MGDRGVSGEYAVGRTRARARLAAAAALCCLRVPMQDAPPVHFHRIASTASCRKKS